MKKKMIGKKLMEELEKFPNVSMACNNVGISRQTFYRWKKFDEKLGKKIDEAMLIGTLSVNDLAESHLIVLIKEGNLGAIKLWLSNNKANYITPRTIKMFEKLLTMEEDRIDKIEVEIIPGRGQITDEDKTKSNKQ